MNVKNYSNSIPQLVKKGLLSLLFLIISFSTFGQEELKRHYVDLNKEFKSTTYNENSKQEITETITQKNATWLRLFFKDVNLGQNSTITITSTLDGESQTLNAEKIKEWNNSSAYFNGNEIKVTLNAAPRETNIGFKIREMSVGEVDLTRKSQCGEFDDRRRSTDNAIGRIVPIGCTGWIIRNGRIVTAGHCATDRAEILEFNVPISNANRSINHPPVRDQYPLSNFVTEYVGGQPRTDWAVARAGANSQTRQTPIQAQRKSFNVVRSTPGNTIRITGFGTDTGRDNQVQQTHTGPLSSLDNTFVRYSTDTTGGNSGSPIIDEATGNAVGVHAYGGCGANGGANFGERATIPAFWAAMGLGDDNPPPAGKIVRMIKRNASGFSIDGRGGSGRNGQNVHLWTNKSNNSNQQWVEIDQGGGYFSYIKRGTEFAMDGRNGGARRQNVHLWRYNRSNRNQHWRKVNVGGGHFRLEKRNAPGFSISGSSGGAKGQNVHLWNSNNNSRNQHWRFVTVNTLTEDQDEIDTVTENVDYDAVDALDVLVYPNPVVDKLSIKLGANSKSGTATIYNVIGQKQIDLKLKEGLNTFNTSSLDLNSGMYLIKINTNSVTTTQKIIVY